MDITDKKKKKKKIKVDGKEYNLSDFDDTYSWSRVKKSKSVKDSALGNMRNLIRM